MRSEEVPHEVPNNNVELSHQLNGLTDSLHEVLDEVLKPLPHSVCDGEREQAVCQAEAAQARALGQHQSVVEAAFSDMLFE